MAYKKILVGTDGSDSATRAITEAAHLAKAVDAEMVVLCVFDPPRSSALVHQIESAPSEVAWRITGASAAESILEDASKVLANEGVRVTTVVEPGDPADMLLQVAEREGCDLIFLGNKGMAGVKRFMLGSVPNKVSHHSPCDVLIAKTT